MMSRFLIIISFAVGLLVACSEKRTIAENEAYKLEEVVPFSAVPGTIVTLYGDYFPDTVLQVMFNGIPADTLIRTTGETVEVIMPPVNEKGKIDVQITTHGGKWVSNTVEMEALAVPDDIPTFFWTTHNIYKAEMIPGERVTREIIIREDHPRGLQVDNAEEKVYWGNSVGQVFSSTMDGEVEQLLYLGFGLLDVTLDNNKEWVYYSKDSLIARVNLKDTSRIEVLYKDLFNPNYLTLSEDGKSLYWSEFENKKIKMGSVEGGEVTVVASEEDGITGPRGFDIYENKIYIANSAYFGQSSILRFDPKRKKLRKMWDTKDGIGEMIFDVLVDQETGNIYWMNSKGKNKHNRKDGEIWSAAVDKSKKPRPIFRPINYGFRLAI